MVEWGFGWQKMIGHSAQKKQGTIIAGRGLPAIKYLSRHLYHGVISEKNIISDDDT